MKILFLSHYADMLGANRSLLSMVLGLKAKGAVVMVWCRKAGSFTEALENANVPFQVFPYHNWADTFLYPGFWLLPLRFLQNKRIMPQLIEAAQAFGPDIIHTNSSVLPIGAYLSERLDIPHVWHIREMAKLHYNMRFFPSRKSLIQHLKRAKRVIVISKKVKAVVIGEEAINWTLVYNGILDEGQIESEPKSTEITKKTSTPFIFLIIGMIHPNKGQMEALQAFALLNDPNSELHIVGEGRKQYTWQLKQFVKEKGMAERVKFHGYIAKPQAMFEKADVVLMCSHNEGMGRVTVEAMAFHKPVIGLDSGATPELIDHQVNGLIYKDGPEDLAKCMRLLMDHPEKGREMGKNGWLKAKEAYTIQQYVESMETVFREVLEASSATSSEV